MSTNAPSIEPEIEDFDHDEPTQFMLQIMQTRIERKLNNQSKGFSGIIRFILSPIGSMVCLLVACLGITEVLAILTNTAGYSNFEEFKQILIIITGFILVLLCIGYFSILLIPIPIKGRILDLFRNDRLLLTGIMSNERWAYITRHFEFEQSAKLIRYYLIYILYSITALGFICLPYSGFNLVEFVSFSSLYLNIIFFVALFISLLISIYRTTLALKWILFNINWSTAIQITVVFSWLIFWFIFGGISKFAYSEDLALIRKFDSIDNNNLWFNLFIYILYISVAILSISKIWISIIKAKKKTIIEILRFNWSINKFYIIFVIVSLFTAGFKILKFLQIKYNVLTLFKLSNPLNSPIILLLTILLAQLLTNWTHSEYFKKKLNYNHFLLYLVSVIVIPIFLFIQMSDENGFFSKENVVGHFINRFTSIYVSLPSIWVFIDTTYLKLIEEFSSNSRYLSLHTTIDDIIQLYIVVSVFPSLFARFMENIALQKPAIPKI